MRDYGKVHTSFWTSETIRSMSEDARNLALYLLTCPHNTIAGVFRLPDGYVCDDMQWTPERVAKAFSETITKGFANRCETTKWVWINKHFEWNPPENPNQRKCAAKIVASVPEQCTWKPAFMRDCAEMIGIKYEPLPNPSPTVPEPVTGAEAGTGINNPPSLRDAPPSGSAKQKSVTFQSWLHATKAKGEKAVSDYKPVWDYAELSGIPADWIEIAWLRFKDRYTGDEKAKRKRYVDWRGVFLRAVKENWLGLWFYSEKSKSFCLTTVGVCADIDTREAA